MASLYFECSGSVVTVSPDTLQCSSGFVQVSEPTFTLITAEQGSSLLTVVMTLVVVIAVFKGLAKIF